MTDTDQVMCKNCICKNNTLPRSCIEWIWAYREQLKLLDSFDAEAIHGISQNNNWIDPKSTQWNKFLTYYNLTRGYQRSLRGKSFDVFQNVQPILSTPLSCHASKINCLNTKWGDSVEAIGRLSKQTKNHVSPKYWSLTSKLMWFYYPNDMTMYDRDAAKGLAKILKSKYKKITHKKYLEKFEELFKDKQHCITQAAKFSDR